MELELTPEQEKLEEEVCTYLKNHVPPELDDELLTHIEGDGPLCRQFVRKLGLDGWAGIGWPGEYGGQDGPRCRQAACRDIDISGRRQEPWPYHRAHAGHGRIPHEP